MPAIKPLSWLLLCLLTAQNSLAQSRLASPLADQQQWQVLSYSGIPANDVLIENSTMVIDVDGSASPVIYPFSNPTPISEISLALEIEGGLNLSGQLQGAEGADDFVFRLGVVYEGEKQLGLLQRMAAPEWVRKLFQLAPKGTGIDRIHFFNVYSDERLANRQRTHPGSRLITEEFLVKHPDKQPISLSFYPQPEEKVLALWISSDGDDTRSSYRVRMSGLTLSGN